MENLEGTGLLPEYADTSFEARWQESVPNEVYHSQKGFISASGLKELQRSPAHFHYYWTNPGKETEAKRVGHLFHGAILESDRFRASMKIMPKFNRATKIGKANHEKWTSERKKDEIIVSQPDYDTILHVLDAVYAHPVARGFLAGGEREWSGFFKEPRHSLKARIRPDLMIRSEGIILDVKTCQDASRFECERSIYKYGYDIQAAFYLMGASEIEVAKKMDRYFFLFVEKQPPYVTTLYNADGALLEHGEKRMTRALKSLDECLKNNEFRGYQKEAEWISVPPWALSLESDDD